MERFGNIFTASGTLNFFGEGWKHHKILKPLFRWNFDDTTLITKTVTIEPREGNPLSKSVKVYPLKEITLNAVGLKCPGIINLFNSGQWQQIDKSFLISFMAIGNTRSNRLIDISTFSSIIKQERFKFKSDIGVELNVSCPNTHCNVKELTYEIIDQLEVLSIIKPIPIVIKINALTPFSVIKEIQSSRLCDAISLSNTIPWGTLSSEINWMELFNNNVSPLQKYGGGGLSGKPLLPIVSKYISSIRDHGIDMYIIGGGGILKPDDVDTMFNSGANAISIGTVTLLKPWNVNKIIKRAKTYE